MFDRLYLGLSLVVATEAKSERCIQTVLDGEIPDTKYKCGQCLVGVMQDNGDDVSIPDEKVARIRERVLKAEKEKLNLDNPKGINDDIQQIIEEEIN